MTLHEWLNADPKRTLQAVAHACQLPYSTCHKIKSGRPARYHTAKLISEYTSGEVTIAELCEPPNAAPAEDSEQAAESAPPGAA